MERMQLFLKNDVSEHQLGENVTFGNILGQRSGNVTMEECEQKGYSTNNYEGSSEETTSKVQSSAASSEVSEGRWQVVTNGRGRKGQGVKEEGSHEGSSEETTSKVQSSAASSEVSE